MGSRGSRAGRARENRKRQPGDGPAPDQSRRSRFAICVRLYRFVDTLTWVVVPRDIAGPPRR
jgi:hypothetical protein